MGKVQELYDGRVKAMGPAERLQLARLILDDLAVSERALDVDDAWSDDDVVDLSAFAAGHAAGPPSGGGQPS